MLRIVCRATICHCAKLCQNLPNGFWRYHDFSISTWLLSAILDFHILVTQPVGRTNMYRHTKFHQIGLTAVGISLLTFLKIAAMWHLGLFKFDFLNSRESPASQCALTCKISSKSVRPMVRYSNVSFFNDSCLPFRICVANFAMTPKAVSYTHLTLPTILRV